MSLDLLQRSVGPSEQHPRVKRVPRMQLPSRQRAVLDVIVQYYRVTLEPCPGSIVARRIGIHHSTVQEHIGALYRKGWLVTANAPAKPTTW